MLPLKFLESNHNLGAPKDWDSEKDGDCAHLPVHYDGESFFSLWRPTKEEIDLLKEGGAVYLRVVGSSHPVVALGAIPAEGFTNAPNHPGVKVPQ